MKVVTFPDIMKGIKLNYSGGGGGGLYLSTITQPQLGLLKMQFLKCHIFLIM
jgi:hypothetical protein